MSRAAHSASERFSGLLLRHRGRTGLTQRELALRVGASRRVVQDWEAGVNVPSAERLQALIAVLFEAGGLTVGSETLEVRALWAAALGQSSRMRTPLDEVWLAGLLGPRAVEDKLAAPAGRPGEGGDVARRQDWGEAPDVIGFVGRAAELETCRTWLVRENMRLVALLGMGGIGKTTLAARLAQDVAPTFQCLYWRSLRDALPFSDWLAGAIGFLSDHQLVPPSSESERLTALLQLLRERRSLLVLDNFETLLDAGGYRQGSTGYRRLLQTVGEGRHQSCLLLTSREAPRELASLGGGVVRTFELGGLGPGEGQVLLAHNQLAGNREEWAILIARFGGNGLALKVVGERIRQLFSGNIGAFLEEESGSSTVFGDIRRLLGEQIERAAALEQLVLQALAVAREPVSLTELMAALGPRVGRGAALDAVEALRRRSLVERSQTDGAAAFTLQPVVLEYVTDRLVEAVSDEIARGAPAQLVERPLIRAQATDYVRQTQERLIGGPILQLLNAQLGVGGTERRLVALLECWRGRPVEEQGFGPGNVVNLLRLLRRGNLRGRDLSRVSIRQAYLAGVEAQEASMAKVDLVEAVLAEAFRPPFAVALSGDGALMALGTSTGEVWLYRTVDRTALLAIQGHTSTVWGVALSPDGRFLASSSADGTVRLWEAPSGRALATLHGHGGAVRGVALSANGRFVAGGSDDGSVRPWDVPSVHSVATLQGHASAVFGVALAADGRLLASGSVDGTVRLWQTPGGGSLGTLGGHTSTVHSVALSADGRLLASASGDGTLRLWETDGGTCVATLRDEPRYQCMDITGMTGVTAAQRAALLALGAVDLSVL